MSSAPVTAKRVSKKEVAAAPVAVVPAPVAAPAPAAAVAEKKVAKKATKAEAAPVAVAAPAAVAAPVVAATTEVAAEAPATSLDDDLKVVLGRLTGLREVVSTMITEVKKLEKRVHREIKDARKRRRRVKAEGEEGAKPRGPSIFEIPTKVTDELCVFLGKPKGTLISRSNVTREINNYVKEKNLKNKHDIKPDASLKKLLRLTDADNLTYFNLQRYLNTHYIKEPKVVAATA
jgi:chromatin remodeling complex protein RSC6